MRRIIAARIAAIFAALVASSTAAQTSFPARTVKFIVPFPGGGINDVLGRGHQKEQYRRGLRHRDAQPDPR